MVVSITGGTDIVSAAQRREAPQLRVTRQLAEASALELFGDGLRERPKPGVRADVPWCVECGARRASCLVH